MAGSSATVGGQSFAYSDNCPSLGTDKCVRETCQSISLEVEIDSHVKPSLNGIASALARGRFRYPMESWPGALPRSLFLNRNPHRSMVIHRMRRRCAIYWRAMQTIR